MGRYYIKVWETEQDRELGESLIVENDIENVDIAIKRAQELMNSRHYASMEVMAGNTVLYFSTPTEKSKFDKMIEIAKKQEKVNKYAKALGLKEVPEIDEKLKGTVENMFKELKDGMDFINSPDSGFEPGSFDEDYEELVNDLKNDYDSKDYVILFEHPMSSYWMIEDIDETLEELEEELLDKYYDMNYKDVDVDIMVEAFLDYDEDFESFEDYGPDDSSTSKHNLSFLYEDCLDHLGIPFDEITTKEKSDGKFTTTIKINDKCKVKVESKSWNGPETFAENIKIIKNKYLEYEKETQLQKALDFKNADLKGMVSFFYNSEGLNKLANFSLEDKFAEKIEQFLNDKGLNVAEVEIKKLAEKRYKTTITFENGYSDYFYAENFKSQEDFTLIIDNFRSSYFKMQDEIQRASEQNEVSEQDDFEM